MDNKNNSAFSTIDEESTFKPISTSENSNLKVEEHEDVFAKGLPDWDLVPDNVVVRRHK